MDALAWPCCFCCEQYHVTALIQWRVHFSPGTRTNLLQTIGICQKVRVDTLNRRRTMIQESQRYSDTLEFQFKDILYNVSRRWGCDNPVGYVSHHQLTGLCCTDGCDVCALSLVNIWCPVSSFQTHLHQWLSLWTWDQIPFRIFSMKPLKGPTWLINFSSFYLNEINFVMGYATTR